jgi:aminoglycoside phosphotransferase (APT) family kinase protein
MSDAAPPTTLDPAALAAIAPKLASGGGTIGRVRRLSGGASQETWSFDLVTAEGVAPLILRRAPPGVAQHESAVGLEAEAAIIRLVAGCGVPVPAVRYVLEPQDRLGRGFVTAHVSGETIARKILRDAAFAAVRPTLAFTLGQILARIHAAPIAQLQALKPVDAAATLGVMRRALDGCADAKPVFELALRWLRERTPESGQLKLVHGDFRNGNLVIAADGVRAVLDWELAHLGDPMEDLGWLCATPWRFGVLDAPVGGFGSRSDLFAGYASVAGLVPAAGHVRWWEVLASLRWGVLCSQMVETFRSGADPTVERAMIARRASESEIDLLRLIYSGD